MLHIYYVYMFKDKDPQGLNDSFSLQENQDSEAKWCAKGYIAVCWQSLGTALLYSGKAEIIIDIVHSRENDHL